MRWRSREYDAPFSSHATEQPLNTSTLWWGMLFGAIGFGFFLYGKKQQATVPLLCGLALMVFPYVVTGTIWLVTIGIVLMVIPWFFRN